jgi:hypothetical protein
MARAGALRLPDELFDQSYRVPKPEETVRYLINEFEPAFDAADFSRCGRDLFVTPQRRDERGQDCWPRRQPRRSGLRIREVESRCSRPTYIDTTFVPLAPGKVPENLVLEASQPTRQRALKDSLLTDLSPRVPLRHIGHPAPRRARGLSLGGCPARVRRPPSGDPCYWRSATSAGSSLTVAKGNSPPRGGKITEHSTIMGVF